MDIAGLAVPVRLCRDAFSPGVGFLVDLESKLVNYATQQSDVQCYNLGVVSINSSMILPVSEAAVMGAASFSLFTRCLLSTALTGYT